MENPVQLRLEKVISSRKTVKPSHSVIHFSDSPVTYPNIQKHLDLFIDDCLTFSQYIKKASAKTMKRVNIIKKN